MLDPLSAAAAKVVSGTLGKIAGTQVTQKWDRSRLRRALDQPTVRAFDKSQTETLEDLTASQVGLLKSLMETTSFAEVIERYVVILIQQGRDRAELVIIDELKELLRLQLNIGPSTPQLSFDLAKALINHHRPLIDAYLTESKLADVLPKSFVGATAAAAAAHYALSKDRTSVLQKILALSDVLAFEEDMRAHFAAKYETMIIPSSLTARKRAKYEEIYVEPELTKVDGTSVTLSSVLTHPNLRVVVKGDPGGGKSTLAGKVALDVAAGHITWAPGVRTAFLLTLREFSRSMAREHRTVAEQIELVCKMPFNVVPPEGAVEYLLIMGRCGVIFDGLDELTDISLRNQIVDAIQSFARTYPITPILVTSRRIGYEHAPLDPERFLELNMGGLERAAIFDYARKWFALDGELLPNSRNLHAESLVKATDDIHDIRQNPLMLSLICSLYSSENWIPANRPELYERCSNYLYQVWDKSRTIETGKPFEAHDKAAIHALALWMLDNESDQRGFPRSSVCSFLTQFLHGRLYEYVDDAEDAANRFLDYCTGRAWILTDVGADNKQNLFGFTHRTFLEYFSALQIVREHPTADGLFEYFHGYIAEGGRDVVAQIAIQVLNERQDGGADAVFEHLLDADHYLSDAGHHATNDYILSFCGQCNS